MALDLTKLSERGQVVIPNEIRKQMRLKEGMKFLVLGVEDTIILRRLELSQERLRVKQLLDKSRKKASKVGFSEAEIERFVRETRKARKAR